VESDSVAKGLNLIGVKGEKSNKGNGLLWIFSVACRRVS
jgi:hypothetical protein